uniref:Uncharacterized protein n=1 Tax=Arundo donax TaxID=35708 RepID=A0A0A9R0R1_ARUDO
MLLIGQAELFVIPPSIFVLNIPSVSIQ